MRIRLSSGKRLRFYRILDHDNPEHQIWVFSSQILVTQRQVHALDLIAHLSRATERPSKWGTSKQVISLWHEVPVNRVSSFQILEIMMHFTLWMGSDHTLGGVWPLWVGWVAIRLIFGFWFYKCIQSTSGWRRPCRWVQIRVHMLDIRLSAVFLLIHLTVQTH